MNKKNNDIPNNDNIEIEIAEDQFSEEDEDIDMLEGDSPDQSISSDDSDSKENKSATKLAVLPKKYGKKYQKKPGDNKKSWFEPAGYTESVSSVHNILKTIVYIIFITVVGCSLAYYAITRINDLYAFVKDTDEVEIVIPENATVNEVADILYNAGIIDYPNFFKFYAELKNASERYDFKAGTYVVNPMMNYDQLFLWLEGTTKQSIVRITIPEGYTVDEIIDLFVAEGFGTREGFVNAIQNYEFENEFLKQIPFSENDSRHYRLEGYLYPDTYDVYTDKSEAYYIYKLLDRFEEVFSEKFQERANELGYTIDQIITIASMIEKEAKIQNEYEIISSVFHNRINNPAQFPKLESDATVVYAIQLATGERIKELSSEDLNIDSPYNTYKYNGLPPGPISNPGYESIASALYPENTKYYFFVSSLSGETFFASTLKEHEANIAKVKKLDEEFKQENQ